ncbi:MAG: hypothetical protein ACOCXA_08720, partial [Planctomycetota bacterium]
DRQYQAQGVPARIGRGRIRLPVGPAAMAMQCQATIHPFLLAMHGPSSFTLVCDRPRQPRLDRPRQEEIQRLIGELAQTFSRFLAACPHQWCAFHDVWEQETRA